MVAYDLLVGGLGTGTRFKLGEFAGDLLWGGLIFCWFVGYHCYVWFGGLLRVGCLCYGLWAFGGGLAGSGSF